MFLLICFQAILLARVNRYLRHLFHFPSILSNHFRLALLCLSRSDRWRIIRESQHSTYHHTLPIVSSFPMSLLRRSLPLLRSTYGRLNSSSTPAGTTAAVGVVPTASSSSQSPLPKHDPITSPVGLTGGAPDEFIRRHCRIYRPSRSASQQGPEYRWYEQHHYTHHSWHQPINASI